MKRLPLIALVAASALFIGETALFVRAYGELRRAQKRPAPARDATASVSRDGLEARVGEAARRAGVVRLTSVEWDDRGREPAVDVRWDGSAAAAAAFVSDMESKGVVGACRRLDLSPNDQGGVRGRAVFDARRGAPPPPAAADAPALARAFLLQRPAPRVDTDALARRREQQEIEARRREAETAAKDAAERAEAERLAEKRRQLENNLTVSGIVNNGREALAFLGRRSGSGGTMMVRTGDAVDGARVSRIDDGAGEVRLDYEGKFQVNLRLGYAGGGQ